MGSLLNGAGDLAIFMSIRDYIYARIDFLTEQILSKNLALAISMVLILLTLWVMVQGYLIATGRSQEGLKGFIFGLGKSYFIIAMALGVASTSNFALRTLTDTMADGVSEIMRGNNEIGSACLTKQVTSISGCKIDQNLAITQTVMGVIEAVDTVDDSTLEEKADRAKWFAGVGTAGPGIVAGTMLIMYRIAMALFIGFSPIFILSLLFKKTAPLFQKWLYYGLATIFSGVLLGAMADIAMDLTSNIATSTFITNKAVFFVTGEGSAGIMQAATQQLGLGLILSTLLVTVPPMAGLFFNGVMGSFSPYSAVAGWNAAPNSVVNSGGTSNILPPSLEGSYGVQHKPSVSSQTQNSTNNVHIAPSSWNTTIPTVSSDKFTNGEHSVTQHTTRQSVSTPQLSENGITDRVKSKEDK